MKNNSPYQAANLDVTTSPSLLLRLRDLNDEQAWLTFEAVYGPIIRDYCRRRGFQEADIDDITQNVVVAVSDSIGGFEYCPHRGRFRSWLATVTANKLRSFVKKEKRYQHLINSVEKFARQPEQDTDWSSIFLQRLFESACQRVQPEVDPMMWQCFWRTWVEHRSADVVAGELGLPIHRVYVNKSRILQRLEKEFKNLSDDVPSAD